MDSIKVSNIIETTFDDGSHWIEYKNCNNIGYEIIEGYAAGADLENKYNSNIELYNKLTNKVHVDTLCGPLRGLIYDTLYSENDMLYIDDVEDLADMGLDAADLEPIKKDIEKYNLYNYIEINTNDYLILIYGGIITKFLF